MIDIEKAKEEFIKYTKNYDLEDANIKRKQMHSLRVMGISKEIAKYIGLTPEEIKIAELIGLLHDIARFEQYKNYHTFRDDHSIDHGDYGVQILEKEIRKYIKKDEYDNIIKTAIKNHNKYQIQEEITDKEELFSKIIRDADKIDILEETFLEFYKGKEELVEKEKIFEEDIQEFRKLKSIKVRKDRKGQLYDIVVMLAFIFDINYEMSLKIIKEKDFINKIFKQFDFKDKKTKILMEEIKGIANNYINDKVK